MEGDSHANDPAVISPDEKHPKDTLTSDIDSEVTLVSESVQPGTQATPSENKENQPPFNASTSGPIESDGSVEPPNRPPPVPPRPSEAERERQLREEVELGAQQDVTEVINNVLFQSECAIRPRGIAPDGEQLDQIKE
jgi:ubiquitin carboxyl-terminal hydrolase 25/28